MMYELLSDTEKQERLLELLEDMLGPVRNHYSSKSQIAFDCPYCSANKGVDHDGKGNLEVNYTKGKFNCWACGVDSGMHGSVRTLFVKCGSEALEKDFKALQIRFSYNLDAEEVEYQPPTDFKLPEEYISLSTAPYMGYFTQYFDYLSERRITKELIDKFQIGCCMHGKYSGRVVLPSYNDEDQLNYFVTRTVYKNKKKFKYMNCDVPKETIIFNEKFVNWNKPVFVVEGPFDHIVLNNSIPLLGKKMSDLMFKTLYENAEKIILVLDPDAWDRTTLIYNKLDGGRLRGKVFATKMPQDIDVSKYNELYGHEALYEHIRKSTIRLID